MSVCPLCGAKNPDSARLCIFCKTRLTQGAGANTAPADSQPSRRVPRAQRFHSSEPEAETPRQNYDAGSAQDYSRPAPTFNPPQQYGQSAQGYEPQQYGQPAQGYEPQRYRQSAQGYTGRQQTVESAPAFTPPTQSAPTFSPPAAPVFTPPAQSAPTFTPPAQSAPTFTPPAAPTFTPPAHSYNGRCCHYHQDEPAVAQCARCGKALCEDCYDSYGVTDGEYAGRALCYDCTRELVDENIKLLGKNKRRILITFIFTLVGMLFGAVFGAGMESGIIPIFIGAMIGGCLWTFTKNLFFRIRGAIEGGGFNLVSIAIGFIVGFAIEAVLSVYRTIVKIIDCIKYLKRTSGFIEQDTSALRQMEEYMEYTIVRNRNRGVDIETLMRENSQLAGNSVAQMALTQTDEQIEANMRSCVARINENGEIIRDFAA